MLMTTEEIMKRRNISKGPGGAKIMIARSEGQTRALAATSIIIFECKSFLRYYLYVSTMFFIKWHLHNSYLIVASLRSYFGFQTSDKVEVLISAFS